MCTEEELAIGPVLIYSLCIYGITQKELTSFALVEFLRIWRGRDSHTGR